MIVDLLLNLNLLFTNVNDEHQIPHRKSLREILPKSATRSRRVATRVNSVPVNDEIDTDNIDNEIKEEMPMFNNRRQGSGVPKKMIWGGVVLAILFIVFVGSSFFTSVKAVVVPKQAKITVDNSVIATKDGLSASSTTLAFNTVSKEITKSVEVASNGTENVSRKATGKITIFNNFATEEQLLIANTRFETPDGKIYRISEPVTVPGQKSQSGKTIPGQISVTVTADQAGDSYNVDKVDFTIPGFEGTPRFDGFYARSITPISGGFIGQVKTITDADRLAAETSLKKDLEGQTLDPAQLEIPENNIALPGATFTTFSTDEKSIDGKNAVTLTGKLAVTAITFDKNLIASYLADKYVPDYAGESVKIKNYDSLKLAVLDEDLSGAENIDSIEVDLKGDAHLIWVIDEVKFKEMIAGKTKSTYTLAIADFPAIQGISLKFMPPWASTIPSNINKITIVESVDE